MMVYMLNILAFIKRFSYAIYYYIEDDIVIIVGVLDLHFKPLSNYQKLQNRV